MLIVRFGFQILLETKVCRLDNSILNKNEIYLQMSYKWAEDYCIKCYIFRLNQLKNNTTFRILTKVIHFSCITLHLNYSNHP